MKLSPAEHHTLHLLKLSIQDTLTGLSWLEGAKKRAEDSLSRVEWLLNQVETGDSGEG